MDIIRHAARRATDPCQALGFRLTVPQGMTSRDPAPGVSVSLVWHRPDGAVIADIDISVFTLPLIVDPAGVLDDAVMHAAGQLISRPRRGHVLDIEDLILSDRRSVRRITACVESDASGRPPIRPYQTVVVLPPPDRAIQAAVLIVARSDDRIPTAAHRVADGLRLEANPDRFYLPPATDLAARRLGANRS
jgi:hypothetical protein